MPRSIAFSSLSPTADKITRLRTGRLRVNKQQPCHNVVCFVKPQPLRTIGAERLRLRAEIPAANVASGCV